MGALPDTAVLDELIKRRLDEILAERLAETLTQLKQDKTPSLAIIATSGTLDAGYLPFILSATAAALVWKASVFFTFYGLQLLKKDISDLKVSPLGNPAMPWTMSFGPQWFRDITWEIPNALRAIVPGFESVATSLMKRKFKDNGVATLTELRDLCVDSGVRLLRNILRRMTRGCDLASTALQRPPYCEHRGLKTWGVSSLRCYPRPRPAAFV